MFKREIGTDIKIEKATLSDFSKYYSDSKYMKAEFEKLVEQESLIPFLAFKGKNFVGKVYFVTKTRDFEIADGKHIGYICNLYVKKSYRNNGIGTKLIDTVKEYAKTNGFTKLTLGVEEDNLKNRYLYDKLGFTDRIKTLNTDLLFKDINGNSIIVNDYIIYSCDL